MSLESIGRAVHPFTPMGLLGIEQASPVDEAAQKLNYRQPSQAEVLEHQMFEFDLATKMYDEEDFRLLYDSWSRLVVNDNLLIRPLGDLSRIIDQANQSGLLPLVYGLTDKLIEDKDLAVRYDQEQIETLRIATWLKVCQLDPDYQGQLKEIYSALCDEEWEDWIQQQAFVVEAMETAVANGEEDLAIDFAEHISAPQICINRLMYLLPPSPRVVRLSWQRLQEVEDPHLRLGLVAMLMRETGVVPMLPADTIVGHGKLPERTQPAVPAGPVGTV